MKKIKKIISKLLGVLPIEALRNPAPKVAVLHLHGVIGATGRFKSSGLTASSAKENITKAFETSGIKAVAISLNSPGGSPSQSSMIYKMIRHEAEKAKLPVYIFAEDVCASGGYWIACAGDEVYAEASSIIGSIGVVSAGFGFQDFIGRHGIERRMQTAGEHKGMLDPFQPQKPEDVARLKAIQNEIYVQFVEHVKACRKEKLKGDEKEMFSGAFWAGTQALEMGLVDGIGDVYGVMRDKLGDKTKFIKIESNKKLLEKLLSSRMPKADDWADAALAAIDHKTHWMRFGL